MVSKIVHAMCIFAVIANLSMVSEADYQPPYYAEKIDPENIPNNFILNTIMELSTDKKFFVIKNSEVKLSYCFKDLVLNGKARAYVCLGRNEGIIIIIIIVWQQLISVYNIIIMHFVVLVTRFFHLCRIYIKSDINNSN